MRVPAKKWPVTASASLNARRKLREAREKQDDTLSSIWVVETDFEPPGKGAGDGVFSDTHDATCPIAMRSVSVGTQRHVLWSRTDLILEELLDIARRH